MEHVPQLRWVVGVAVCFQFAATFLPYDVPPKTFRLLAGQGWRDRSTAATFGAEVQAATVGYLAQNRGPAYVLYGPDLARKVVYLRASEPDALAKTLAEQRVEVIYAAKILTEAQTAALMKLSRQDT